MEPVLVTRTETRSGPSVGTWSGTSRLSYAKLVYDSPNPKGAAGVVLRLVTSSPSPSATCRYEYGCAPAERGRLIGSRPEGLIRPERTPATAPDPSSPGKKA